MGRLQKSDSGIDANVNVFIPHRLKTQNHTASRADMKSIRDDWTEGGTFSTVWVTDDWMDGVNHAVAVLYNDIYYNEHWEEINIFVLYNVVTVSNAHVRVWRC